MLLEANRSNLHLCALQGIVVVVAGPVYPVDALAQCLVVVLAIEARIRTAPIPPRPLVCFRAVLAVQVVVLVKSCKLHLQISLQSVA